MNEHVDLQPGWQVVLDIPECELRFPGCGEQSTHGLRIHTCKFHYVCVSCSQKFLLRVEEGYEQFTTMRCRDCKMNFGKRRFYNIVKL